MTREEAITYLKVIWDRYKSEYEIERETLDAYHMAIEALQREDNLLKSLETNEPIQADRPHGEWIDEDGNKVPLDKDGYPLGSCWCNQCHEWLVGSDEYYTKGNFCPSCGAKMVEDYNDK